MSKNLKNVDSLDLHPDFSPLHDSNDLPVLNESQIKEFSTDSYLCYRLVNTVRAGILPPNLARRECGSLSPWLTTQIALLLVWRTRKHNLQCIILKNLKILVQ